MAEQADIDLNRVIPMLQACGSNTIELYETGGQTKKTMREVHGDVCTAVAALEKRGLRAGSRVGIIGRTDYHWIVIDLACLAKGVITVPLDAEATWDIEKVTADYALDVILTNRPDVAAAGTNVVSFEGICSGEPGPALVPSRFGEDDPFTMIFTSGTSGAPKAIEVRKKCFDDQFSNALRMFEITADDRMLVFLPMHIYLERCYIYLAILRGFDVVVTTPRFIVKALKGAGLTFTVGVPHFFQSLQDLFMLEVNANPELQSQYRMRCSLHERGDASVMGTPFAPFRNFWGGRARFFLTGSARCSEQVLRFYEAMGIPLYEGYGWSEIAGMLALNYPGHTKLGTVGKIFPNKEIKLDEHGQILVRGENVANTGYYRASPEIDAETFLADGWMATGDVGHFDSDGYLTIDGRIKDVIVLSNGLKIQPGPIEARINGMECIDNSVVLGDERPYLVALVSLKSAAVERGVVDAHIRELNKSRPESERVKKFLVLDEKLTVENGLLNRSFKINRKVVKAKYAGEIDELYDA